MPGKTVLPECQHIKACPAGWKTKQLWINARVHDLPLCPQGTCQQSQVILCDILPQQNVAVVTIFVKLEVSPMCLDHRIRGLAAACPSWNMRHMDLLAETRFKSNLSCMWQRLTTACLSILSVLPATLTRIPQQAVPLRCVLDMNQLSMCLQAASS